MQPCLNYCFANNLLFSLLFFLFFQLAAFPIFLISSDPKKNHPTPTHPLQYIQTERASMAMAFPQLPPWLWRSVEQVNEGRRGSTDSLHVLEEGKASRAAAAAAESGARQQQQQGQQRQRQQARSKRGVMRQRRGSRQWMERQVDQEFDMVLVPSDGCCMSGSESDDSDWSVGWLEPHSSDFSDTEDSFAVLVPCYGSSSPRLAAASLGSNVAGHGEEQNPPAVWAAVLSTLSRRNAAEQRKHVEQWLSSLQQQ